MHPRSIGRPSRMQVLALVSLGGVALFIWQQDISSIPQAFAGANVLLVGAALALHVSGHVLRAARWRFLLAHAGDCGHWAALQALTLGAAANNLLPAKVGVLIRAHLVCRRTQMGHSAVAGSLVLEALLDAVVLLALLLLAVTTMGLEPALRGGAAVVAGAIAVLLSVGAWISRGRGAAGARSGVFPRVLSRVLPGPGGDGRPPPPGAALRETGLQFRRGMQSLRQPRRATDVALTTVVSWAASAAAPSIWNSQRGSTWGCLPPCT